MGNRICGLNEAFALSGYTDFRLFRQMYVGTYPTRLLDITYRGVTSVINPAFMYEFNRTQDEIAAACKNMQPGDADMQNIGICNKSDMLPVVTPEPQPTITQTPAK